MRLGIVVLTTGRPDLAIHCLESLAAEVSPPHDRVVVVLNGGPPGDVDRVREAITRADWSAWASLMPRRQNDGYSRANNDAVRALIGASHPPDYVLLLNDDTSLRSGALAELRVALAANAEIAIAGCGLEEPDGRLQTCAFRFPSLASELEGTLRVGFVSRLLARWTLALPPSRAPRRVDWVPGAAMAVRRDVWLRIGLLDEHFFLYFDDIDFCLRARRAGLQCWVLPQSRVIHWRGQTTGVRPENAARQRRPPYWYRSRRYLFEKHHGWWYATAVDAVVVAASVLRRALAPLRQRAHDDPPHFLTDTLRYGVLAGSAIQAWDTDR